MSETTIGGSAVSGYKNKETKTVSGTFVVPAGVYKVLNRLQGAGSAGAASTTTTPGKGGQCGAFVEFELYVQPGDILRFVIGSGGIGIISGGRPQGGNTELYHNGKLIALAPGGVDTDINTLAPHCVYPALLALAATPQPAANDGNFPLVLPQDLFSTIVKNTGGTNQNNNGTSSWALPIYQDRYLSYTGGSTGGNFAAGWGYPGANSYYGRGGNGFAADVDGQNAPTTSYGAGGAGAGKFYSIARKGGNGANGVGEVFY